MKEFTLEMVLAPVNEVEALAQVRAHLNTHGSTPWWEVEQAVQECMGGHLDMLLVCRAPRSSNIWNGVPIIHDLKPADVNFVHVLLKHPTPEDRLCCVRHRAVCTNRLGRMAPWPQIRYQLRERGVDLDVRIDLSQGLGSVTLVRKAAQASASILSIANAA